MLERWIVSLQSLPPEGILAVAFLVTLVENLFPPSPSDTLLVFCGVLVGLGAVDFPAMVLVATLGSVVGFSAMFWLGYQFGIRLVDTRRLRFLPLDALEQVERWFQRYGYWVIVANRFLSGTRAVISFAAGMSKLSFPITLVLSAVSALVWNTLLITAGWSVGQNWQELAHWVQLYGSIITAVVLAFGIGWVLWLRLRARKAKQSVQ